MQRQLISVTVAGALQKKLVQKKLLAVAIAGAFGAPALALAQSSTVQIYGNMYL